MSLRTDLHDILLAILGLGNVYFQPPSSIMMNYPCILYSRDNFDLRFANDQLYNLKTKYTITVIDSNPDSTIPSKILGLPLTTFNRHYVADNLNHDVYNTYF